MPYVYRIEHETKLSNAGHYSGPFFESSDIIIYGENAEIGFEPTHHPPPNRDGITIFDSGVDISATLSLDMLLEWFPCPIGREALQELGYCIRCYHV